MMAKFFFFLFSFSCQWEIIVSYFFFVGFVVSRSSIVFFFFPKDFLWQLLFVTVLLF